MLASARISNSFPGDLGPSSTLELMVCSPLKQFPDIPVYVAIDNRGYQELFDSPVGFRTTKTTDLAAPD
jgi:hypothetical protein